MERWGNPIFDYLSLGRPVWLVGGHLLFFYVLGLLLLAFLLMAGFFLLYEAFAWLDVFREVRHGQDHSHSHRNDSTL